MTELLLVALGLGVAGIDPAGALIAAASLAAGARDRHVAIFGVVALAGTIALGTILSLVLGPRLAEVDWSALIPADLTAAVIESVLALLLVSWGIIRTRRPTTKAPKPRAQRSVGAASLFGAGALFALAAVLDPTFVSIVVIAGRDGGLMPVLAAHVVWALVSQLPLLLILVMMASRKHGAAVEWFQDLWSKAVPYVRHLGTVALLAVGAFLLADAIAWWLTGRFLVFD